MFNIINKKEYFNYLENGSASITNFQLKGIQDGFILNLLKDKKNLNIAEMGGGESRVLEVLKNNNHVWNIDQFEGKDNGPSFIPKRKKINIIKAFIGDFSKDILSEFFDIVFSISVIEHIEDEKLSDVFNDIHRILKQGGLTYHAIDVYVGTERKNNHYVKHRCETIINAIKDNFEFIEEPKIVLSDIVFDSSYATHSDIQMYHWNKISPALIESRENQQLISLKLGLKKI